MEDKEALERLAKSLWNKSHPPKRLCKKCKRPTIATYCEACTKKLLRRE